MDHSAMTGARRPGLPARAVRAAALAVLAVLTVSTLTACGSASSELCKRAAGQRALGELDLAGITYAEAERQKPKGCGKKGLEEVARDQAAVAVAVARAQAAERARDTDDAIAQYSRALRLDVREGTAIFGLRRLVRTTTDVGEHWQVAMTLLEQGYPDRARAEVAKTIKQYPKEPVPEPLAALAPAGQNGQAGAGSTATPRSTAGSSATAAPTGGASSGAVGTPQARMDQRGAENLTVPLELDQDEGPGFFTFLLWVFLVIIGVLFLVVVVLSRGGNEHVIPKAFAGAAELADRFATRQPAAGGRRGRAGAVPATGAAAAGTAMSGTAMSGTAMSGTAMSGTAMSGPVVGEPATTGPRSGEPAPEASPGAPEDPPEDPPEGPDGAGPDGAGPGGGSGGGGSGGGGSGGGGSGGPGSGQGSGPGAGPGEPAPAPAPAPTPSEPSRPEPAPGPPAPSGGTGPPPSETAPPDTAPPDTAPPDTAPPDTGARPPTHRTDGPSATTRIPPAGPIPDQRLQVSGYAAVVAAPARATAPVAATAPELPDTLPPEQAAVASGALLGAHLGDPEAASYGPAATDAPQPEDLTAEALARPAHPSRWKLRGIRKRRNVPSAVVPPQPQAQLLGPPVEPQHQPSSSELMGRVLMLERRHQAQQNDLARLSSRKDAEVTSVLVTAAHTPWNTLRSGRRLDLTVVDTRIYWSGKGRENYTPGSMVVRQATATVPDEQRDALLKLVAPAPLDDVTWHVGQLTELVDGLVRPPGSGDWTRWWESPSQVRFETVTAGQGSLTDQWRAVVLGRPVPATQSPIALAPLLPPASNQDVRLRTTFRLRDLANSLGLDPGSLLPVGRQVYALTTVLSSPATAGDEPDVVAAVERSVSQDVLSQGISREVRDTLGEDLGVVGTQVIDVLASAGSGATRRKQLREFLEGARRELAEAADTPA